jgi:hypothetical protein
MRLRHSQEEGSGRPDEVVAAIAERLGMATPSRVEAAASRPASTRDAEALPSLGEAASGEGGRRAINDRTTDSGSVGPDANRAVRRGTLEVLRAVRERMWLAGELEPRLQDPSGGQASESGGRSPQPDRDA